MLVGFEDQILPALLAGADDAIRGLSNIAPKLFNGLVRRPSTAATSRKRRSCIGASSPLVAVYTLSAPGFDSAKLAIKKLGFPPSPILPAPPDSAEAIETTLEKAGLLPVQGEA